MKGPDIAAKVARAAIPALALVLMMLPPASADDVSFMAEPATLDTTPAAKPAPEPLPESTVLQGGVHKRQLNDPDTPPQNAPPPDGSGQALQGTASDNGVQLKPMQANRDEDPVFKIAAQKLESRQKLSAEEYRSLQAGCFGYETDRTFFTETSVVSIVYKDGPADRAGIHRGDKIIVHENDDAARKDPSQPRQQVTCGLAGTSETITLKRHGHDQQVTLTRMNIEDIQEPSIRREWEDLVRQLGYPREGNFSGTSLKNLSRDN